MLIETRVNLFHEIYFYNCLFLKSYKENWLSPVIHFLMVLEQLSISLKIHVNIKDFTLQYLVPVISYDYKQKMHYYAMLNLTFLLAAFKNT